MTDIKNNERSTLVSKAFEDPHWYVNGYAANIRIRCETVQDYAVGHKIESILDIGCGDGSLSLPFLSSTCKVTYVDLSNSMLELVRKRIPTSLPNQASFICGDISTIKLLPSQYDAILLVGVLAYVADIEAIALRMKQLISPNGILVLECTDAAHFFGKLNFGYRDLTSLLKPGKCHTFQHRAPDVVKAFNDAGFDLRRTFRYSYSFPVFNRFLNQRSVYWLANKLFGSSRASKHSSLGSELLMLFSARS